MLTELKEIGLSDNEAKVYLAMLELGPASALAIAARARINRPTAYAQIESLKKIGLIALKKKGGKTLYVAEPPEKLDFLISKQRAEVEVRKEKLQRIMPDLMAAFNLTEEAPIVRYFEGMEGWAKVRQEELRTKEKFFRSISPLDTVTIDTPDAFSKRPAERMERKIYSRIIYTSKKGPVLKRTDKAQMRESKFIPAEKLNLKFDFLVFDDKVVMSVSKKMGTIIIQNKDIAESFKNLFDFIWESIPGRSS
jgi:sugar-specific transcriptional regulator TrmB